MVSTRRSKKGKSGQNEDELTAEHAVPSAPSPSKTEPKNEGRLSAREKRRRQREEMRSKSTGVGISIATTNVEASPNKKIVFDDADEQAHHVRNERGTELPNEKLMKKIAQGDQESVSGSDDHDDDVIEEMTSSVARIEARKERERELANIREADFLSKKRKRKKRFLEQAQEPAKEDDAEELADSFFEKLDAENEQERSSRRKKKTEEPSGRHTTFVVKDENGRGSKPRRVNQNLQVVVLKEPDQSLHLPLPSGDAFTASEAAMIYSRGRLNDGSDVATEKQMQKAKKAGKKTVDNTTWKRSKKMNRLLLPGAKNSRRKGHAAAPSFVFKM